MNEIAIIARRMRTRVRQNIFSNLIGLSPNNIPDTSAAKKHPLPVADSQLKSYRAPSGVGLLTTGAARVIALCKYGQFHPGGPGRTLPSACTTIKAGVVALFIANFTEGSPHVSTNSDKTANGIHAFATVPAGYLRGATYPSNSLAFHSPPMSSASFPSTAAGFARSRS